MNPNTYSRIFTHAFAAGLREARDMDEEETEIGVIYGIEEVRDLLEEEIIPSRDVYALVYGIQTLIETHISKFNKVEE